MNIKNGDYPQSTTGVSCRVRYLAEVVQEESTGGEARLDYMVHHE